MQYDVIALALSFGPVLLAIRQQERLAVSFNFIVWWFEIGLSPSPRRQKSEISCRFPFHKLDVTLGLVRFAPVCYTTGGFGVRDTGTV